MESFDTCYITCNSLAHERNNMSEFTIIWLAIKGILSVIILAVVIPWVIYLHKKGKQ